PLGLELAAAWAEMLSLDEIAQEVERSADFLAAEWSDAPARQRSMRAVFDWSWRLLNDAERHSLLGLSVFRGGFIREAADVVVGASLRVLTRLMHKSLLRWSEAGGIGGRFDIHELLRQFAAEQLDASGERAAVEARHGEYYLHFVAERERRLARNQPREAAAEIRAEIDNVRQAWIWAASQAQAAVLEDSAYGVWQYADTAMMQCPSRPASVRASLQTNDYHAQRASPWRRYWIANNARVLVPRTFSINLCAIDCGSQCMKRWRVGLTTFGRCQSSVATTDD